MIYLVPEFKTESGEVINVVNQDNQAIGYIAYLYQQNENLYVFGSLENKGEQQNFVDTINHFVAGLQKITKATDNTQVYIDVGGEPLDIKINNKQQNNS